MELRGHLDLVVLGALRRGPLHGYAVIEELRRISEGTFDLQEGTVYPALHRLEQAGFIKSRWASAGGRRRRVYTLTARGRTQLERGRREWKAVARAVDLVVGRA
jgi:PadR family transcriptional regulator PadR